MSISASVGKNGKNVENDIKVVQKALNNHSAAGGYSKLAVNGKLDPMTIAAISAFQKKVLSQANPDGRVDPGGATLKALLGAAPAPSRAPAAPSRAPAAPAGKAAGGLKGPTAGVQKDIIDFATEVAKFYGTVITISSGKRDAKGQGQAMFNNWTGNLKRGKIYSYLTTNKKLLDELESLYKAAKEDKTKTQEQKDKAKADFIARCGEHAAKLSLHVAGKAIDVAPKNVMTASMREAMRTGLRELVEASCYHYDTKGAAPPATAALKQKWKPK